MSFTTELRKFVAPEIITGIDARLTAGRYIPHFLSKKPMIVTDAKLVNKSWFQDIIESIKKNTPNFIVYSGVTSNPRDFEVHNGAELFIKEKCDLLIAVGGGSPIDCAKGISIVSTNGGSILDYEGVDQINLPGPPLICIPTTSGASADVSQFAIICDTKNHVKKAIISKKAVPDLALLDPIPLMTMDPYLTACTGMDALTHAVEAYVSNASSPLTDVHALRAVELINANIEQSVLNIRTLETMYSMMLGSLHAGLAFSNASLGAVHAMAHSLGGLLDLPHGECNSILLEHVVSYNFDAASERYTDIVRVCGLDTKNAQASLVNRIRTMRINLGITQKIKPPQFTPQIIDTLAQRALADPCIVTNPKNVSFDVLKSLYARLLT